MEKISRKGFLKVAAAAAMSGVTAGALAACNSAASSSTAASGDAIYTAGTYTGTATGIGEVKVTMTFSETAITEVVIDASNETESIGGVAAPTLQEAIMAAQAPRSTTSPALPSPPMPSRRRLPAASSRLWALLPKSCCRYRRGYRR